MATPKEVYESDMYRKLAHAPHYVSWVWFADVYKALGEALGNQEDTAQEEMGDEIK